MSFQANVWAGYQQYCQYIRSNFQNMPVPDYNDWYRENFVTSNQIGANNYSNSSSNFSCRQERQEGTSSAKKDETANTLNLKEQEGLPNETGKSKRDRWGKQQTAVLMNAWKDNVKIIESHNNHQGWNRIKAKVDEVGPEKTIKQIKDKIRNLKDLYKAAKDNNKKSGAEPQTSPHYDIFDEVLGTRACQNLNITQIGVEDQVDESNLNTAVLTNNTDSSIPGMFTKSVD